jgi:8-oxo-dGTP pyrophosphatase MutT (NUDIX family)
MDLRTQLSVYGQRWPAEAETLKSFIGFIESDRNCFERSNAYGHVTGSAWLVDPSGNLVLLTHHKKLNVWIQLGGHADGESDILSVAIREAQEESGIHSIDVVSLEIFDLDIHTVPSADSMNTHLHFDIRYALRAQHINHSKSDESHDLVWVDVTKINAYTSEESMLRMAQKWLAFIRS